MSQEKPENPATAPSFEQATVEAPPVESGSRAAALVRGCLLGALLGVMLCLGALSLSRMMIMEGGGSFAGWAGRVVHDGILQKPGVKMINKVYGEDAALSLRGDIRVLYILLGVVLVGVGVGGVAGLAVGLLRLRLGSRPAEPFLPWSIPLGLAILGIFYHGFVWSNVAVLLLPRSRRRAWVTAAVWVIAFLTVLGWAWALEMDWPEGWSKMYPWSRKVFFFLGHAVGAKE